MGDQLILRPLRPADMPALADLWVRSWQETMPAIDFAARRDWIVGFLAGPEAGARATLVAERDGTPVGFVTTEPARRYLHQLVVASSAKGGASGKALLDAAKRDAADGLMLDVNQDNARAVRFYEREGFVRESAGVNAASGLKTWRMVWRLPLLPPAGEGVAAKP
ncbi:GNAT family N-acetyltransferase [Beijerinckia sp. L45]|uniref:GNAT family N-acetyltransferase n=1 Tax=Beijerinckia sp. L45 TaxID=1641855 RepID=UPI001FED74A0|nr:GNAT family N-acetyltransferase [Beijerinckia sp. L45]